MSRARWDFIKHTKGFYVRTFHWVKWALMLSCSVMVFLLLLICRVYLTQKPSHFYATSGESMPILLSPMNHPNESSQAILGNDLSAEPVNGAIALPP